MLAWQLLPNRFIKLFFMFCDNFKHWWGWQNQLNLKPTGSKPVLVERVLGNKHHFTRSVAPPQVQGGFPFLVTLLAISLGNRSLHRLKKCYSRCRVSIFNAAVTRIRTWVASATTKSTNHYTITAIAVRWTKSLEKTNLYCNSLWRHLPHVKCLNMIKVQTCMTFYGMYVYHFTYTVSPGLIIIIGVQRGDTP